MSHVARSLFVRPNNILLSNLLQTLAIVNEISTRSRGSLTYFRFQREPDQSRLLNFGSLTFDSRESARDVEEQAQRIRVPLNSRAACDKATLSTTKTGVNRDVGLKEVARAIGIDLHTQDSIEDDFVSAEAVILHRSGGRTNRRMTLSDVDEDVEEGVFDVTLKLEKRQKEARALKRRGRESKERLAFMKFGGFSNP